MRGQTSAPAHSHFDQKFERFNGKTIISAEHVFFTCKLGFFFLISFSSLLRNEVRATVLSVQPVCVGHNPEQGLSLTGGWFTGLSIALAALTQQQQQQHSLRQPHTSGSDRKSVV